MDRIFRLSACGLVLVVLAAAVWPLSRSSAPAAHRPPGAGLSKETVRRPARSLDSRHAVTGSLSELAERWQAAASEEEREWLNAEFAAWLAKSDPAELFRSFREYELDAAWVNAALRRWIERSPGDVLVWLQAQPEPGRYSHIRDEAMTAWARNNSEGALRWALTQSEGKDRDHLFARIAIGYADRDPTQADAFAQKMLPRGEALQHAIEGIADAWAKTDPASAATWALGATDSQAERQPLDLVLYSWFDEDPAVVREWVRELPAAKERDLLWWRLLHWQVEKNPAEAGTMLTEISDDTLRAQAARDLVGHWAREDFATAGEWVLRTPLPLRTRLLADLEAIAVEPPKMFP